MPIIIMLHHFQLRRSDSRLHPMDAVSREEILIAYICCIGTVALFLWRSRVVSGRDDCGPPRAGQSEPAPRPRAKLAPAPASRGAVYAQSAFSRSSRDLRAPDARAEYGMREPAFSRSDPALTGIRNGELGRTPSSARRGAYVREAWLVQSAPSFLETSGLTRGGMGGEQHAGRTPSSARMLANAREAPATPGSPAVPPSCSQWLFENESGVSALEERCA
jgi:hypothetical protein